jgi:hypothetical protein
MDLATQPALSPALCLRDRHLITCKPKRATLPSHADIPILASPASVLTVPRWPPTARRGMQRPSAATRAVLGPTRLQCPSTTDLGIQAIAPSYRGGAATEPPSCPSCSCDKFVGSAGSTNELMLTDRRLEASLSQEGQAGRADTAHSDALVPHKDEATEDQDAAQG